MRPWRFDLRLESHADVPLRTQLGRALIQEIQRGRLAPGAALPGSRTLAAQLQVNRKVVVAAVDDLVTQGWLTVQRARGVRVAEDLPTLAVADVESPRKEVKKPVSKLLTIGDGIPDARIAPFDELSRAQHRALRSLTRFGLGYGDPAGDPTLREVLASFVNQARGLSCSAEQVVLTRGSQGALSLFALAMLRPGDLVAVESPGYAQAWQAFGIAGAKVVHVPVDGEGLRTDLLEARAKRSRIKAVYVTPHHQYPTAVSLSAERRMHLQQLAERFDFTIVEDDYDYEYHFEGSPLLPLSASSPDRCVYVASLSKLLAPAIRLGYVVASERVATQLKQARAVLDRQGDVVLERAVAELFDEGVVQRHARRARRVYKERRDHLLAELAAKKLKFDLDVPTGGLALWLRLRSGSVEALARKAHAGGVILTPGSAHLPSGQLDAFRFGYAAHTTQELTRICAALQ